MGGSYRVHVARAAGGWLATFTFSDGCVYFAFAATPGEADREARRVVYEMRGA